MESRQKINMVKRLATGLILIGILTASLTVAPVWLFKVLVVLLSCGALIELYRLLFKNDYFSQVTGLLYGLLVTAILVFFGLPLWLFPLVLGFFFILSLFHMAHFTTVEGSIKRLGLVLFGTLYICAPVSVVSWLRGADHGRSLIVFAISIVALGDTFAYAAGKSFGKHKMSPLISPNKTFEGLIASFFGGIIASLICWKVFWPGLPLWLIIFLGVSVAFIGAMGDLVESMLKRDYHVKDSGSLLPGHGGILDRIDALIFAIPFIFFLFKFLGLI